MAQQVKPGDRVVIHGLQGKPELNGKSAVLVGQAANGRVTVKLDSGEQVAVKQANLGIQPPGGGGMPGGGMPGAGGGMPGFGGGMPGFGGGMPGFGGGGMPGGFGGGGGGMPGMQNPFAGMMGKAAAAIEPILASLGMRLPPGVNSQQVVMGVAAVAMISLWMISYWLSWKLIGLVALVAFAATQTDPGRVTLAQCSARVSSLIGKPIQPNQLLLLVCAFTAVVGHQWLSSSSITAEPAVDAWGVALKDAYQQGYDDGIAGRSPRPPKHIPRPDYNDSPARSESSGFGIGSLIRYAMVGSYVYRMGCGPAGFSPQLLMANLQANPMQAFMMLMMVSGYMF